MIPQSIFHKNLNITQVPFLRFDTPEDGSIKTLCIRFFEALDDVLSTTYAKDFRNFSKSDLLPLMSNKVVLHFIGVLIIDEVQDLKGNTPLEVEKTLKFLKHLTNKIGVPIIFIGTPEAAKIIFGNLQQASRAQGTGSIVWDRLENHSAEWDLFIEALFRFRLLKKQKKLSEALKEKYYELTQGISRLVVILHCLAQRYAIYIKSECITEELLEVVSRNEMFGTEHMITGIRTRDHSILNQYKDISMLYSQTLEHLEEKDSLNKDDKWSEIREFAIKNYKKIDPLELDQVIDALKDSSPDLSVREIIIKLKKLISDLLSKKKVGQKAKGKPKGDLVELCNGETDPRRNYEKLKNAGYVIKLEDMLGY